MTFLFATNMDSINVTIITQFDYDCYYYLIHNVVCTIINLAGTAESNMNFKMLTHD